MLEREVWADQAGKLGAVLSPNSTQGPREEILYQDFQNLVQKNMGVSRSLRTRPEMGWMEEPAAFLVMCICQN
jgi:hypothetical protein